MGETGFGGGAQETSEGGRGGHPPVDAPLGVDPQDGGVLGVVVSDLGVGELSAVDVDDNGGTAGALPGGRQASDLPGIPPEDAGAGAHLRRRRASRLHHQQAERESPARPLHLPTYGTGHSGPVSRLGPLPVSPCEGPGAVCAYLGRSLALSPDAALRGREAVLGSAWQPPRLRGGSCLTSLLSRWPHPQLRLLGSVNQQACPCPSLREPGPRVPRAGLPGGKGLAGPHSSPAAAPSVTRAAAGPLHGRGSSTGGAHGFNVLGGLEYHAQRQLPLRGGTHTTHAPPAPIIPDLKTG